MYKKTLPKKNTYKQEVCTTIPASNEPGKCQHHTLFAAKTYSMS